MIEPRELRIGNYVNFLGKPKKIIGLSKRNYNMNTETTHHYAEFENHIPVMFTHLKPIPLTEEILLKYGFERWVDDVLYLNIKIGRLEHKLRVFEKIGHVLLDHDKRIGEDLKHLHQLQNLYHSLTGKELEIEL